MQNLYVITKNPSWEAHDIYYPVRKSPDCKKMIWFCAALLFTCIITQAQQTQSVKHDSSVAFPSLNTYANAKFSYKITDAPNHTYCYDVFVNEKLFIHQTSIPAISGYEGFKTKEDASKVALLVLEKIKKGEMPPAISIEEMKKLKVIK
jgi:hypothetical protein